MHDEDIAAIVKSALEELEKYPAVDMPCLSVCDADTLAAVFRLRGFEVQEDYAGRLYPIVRVKRRAE